MQGEGTANSNGLPMYHLRRSGPPSTMPGVADIMDMFERVTVIGRQRRLVNYVLDSSDSRRSEYISRIHALVERKDNNEHYLFDDSKSGIYVNDIRISGKSLILLCDGDRVTFGHRKGKFLAPGTRVQQPDSEYQFIFERCHCVHDRSNENDQHSPSGLNVTGSASISNPTRRESTTTSHVVISEEQNDQNICNQTVSAECAQNGDKMTKQDTDGADILQGTNQNLTTQENDRTKTLFETNEKLTSPENGIQQKLHGNSQNLTCQENDRTKTLLEGNQNLMNPENDMEQTLQGTSQNLTCQENDTMVTFLESNQNLTNLESGIGQIFQGTGQNLTRQENDKTETIFETNQNWEGQKNSIVQALLGTEANVALHEANVLEEEQNANLTLQENGRMFFDQDEQAWHNVQNIVCQDIGKIQTSDVLEKNHSLRQPISDFTNNDNNELEKSVSSHKNIIVSTSGCINMPSTDLSDDKPHCKDFSMQTSPVPDFSLESENLSQEFESEFGKDTYLIFKDNDSTQETVENTLSFCFESPPRPGKKKPQMTPTDISMYFEIPSSQSIPNESSNFQNARENSLTNKTKKVIARENLLSMGDNSSSIVVKTNACEINSKSSSNTQDNNNHPKMISNLVKKFFKVKNVTEAASCLTKECSKLIERHAELTERTEKCSNLTELSQDLTERTERCSNLTELSPDIDSDPEFAELISSNKESSAPVLDMNSVYQFCSDSDVVINSADSDTDEEIVVEKAKAKKKLKKKRCNKNETGKRNIEADSDTDEEFVIEKAKAKTKQKKKRYNKNETGKRNNEGSLSILETTSSENSVPLHCTVNLRQRLTNGKRKGSGNIDTTPKRQKMDTVRKEAAPDWKQACINSLTDISNCFSGPQARNSDENKMQYVIEGLSDMFEEEMKKIEESNGASCSVDNSSSQRQDVQEAMSNPGPSTAQSMAGSIPAPHKCFKQWSVPLDNEFEPDMKLKAVDARNSSPICLPICLATVMECVGPRLLLRLDGTDNMNDFWRLVDSDDIFPIVDCEDWENIRPPLGFQKDISFFDQFLKKSLRNGNLAPGSCFKKTPPTPQENYFEVGMKLEVVDRKYPHYICPATVGAVKADHILVTFDGWLDYYDYWCRFDSRDIFPIGWCKQSGHHLQQPGGKQVPKTHPKKRTTTKQSNHGKTLQRSTSQQNTKARSHPNLSHPFYVSESSSSGTESGQESQEEFKNLGPSTSSDLRTSQSRTAFIPAPQKCFKQWAVPPDNKFVVDMKLKAEDPRSPSLTCVATVVGYVGPRLILHLDGSDNKNDFWKLVDSEDISPLGHCKKEWKMIMPPVGFQKDISFFHQFLEKTLCDANLAPKSCFKKTPPTPHENYFEIGMKLEAVDQKYPEFIRPATVGDVDDEHILVTFDGWPDSSDYWCRFDSRDIFPIGWCKQSGHILQQPDKNGTKTHSKKRTTTKQSKNAKTFQRSTSQQHRKAITNPNLSHTFSVHE